MATLRWRAAWLGANVLSYALIGALFHNFPVERSFPPDLDRLGPFTPGPALFGLALGLIPALLVGALQRALLTRTTPVSRLWPAAAAAGVGAMHLIADGFERAADLTAAVVVGGLIAGLLQWGLAGPGRPAAAWFALSVPAAWLAGWALGGVALEAFGLLRQPWTPSLGLAQHGLLGLAVGAAVAIGDGLLWRRILAAPAGE